MNALAQSRTLTPYNLKTKIYLIQVSLLIQYLQSCPWRSNDLVQGMGADTEDTPQAVLSNDTQALSAQGRYHTQWCRSDSLTPCERQGDHQRHRYPSENL